MISVEAGDSAPVKKLNGLVEGGSFDQILDLGDVADSNKSLVPEMPAPMMAFEESIQSQSQSAATAGTYHPLILNLTHVVIQLLLTDLIHSALYIFSSRNET